MAAPTPSAQRAPKSSDTQPAIGPPMGVEPRKTTASRARTRPRIAGSVPSCTTVFEPEMTMTLVMPTGITARYATAVTGARASRIIDTPSARRN